MFAAATAALMVAAPASAQTYSAEVVKKSVTLADLGAIVGSLGHEVLETDQA